MISSGLPFRAGDGVCPVCGDHCFRRRTLCGSCHEGRPPAPGDRPMTAKQAIGAQVSLRQSARVGGRFTRGECARWGLWASTLAEGAGSAAGGLGGGGPDLALTEAESRLWAEFVRRAAELGTSRAGSRAGSVASAASRAPSQSSAGASGRSWTAQQLATAVAEAVRQLREEQASSSSAAAQPVSDIDSA